MSNILHRPRPNFLDSIQIFDGTQPELSEAEKQAAAVVFKSIVHDLFLANIGQAKRLNGRAALYPCDYSQLDLTVQQEDGSRLGVDAKSFDTSQAKTAPYSLSVFERVPFGRPFRHVRYKMAPDGSEVVRHDAADGPLELNVPLTKEKLTPLTGTERGVAFQGLASVWEDEFKRRDLERRLGLNDQPVGLTEVQSLAQLVEGAAPTF